MDFENLENRFKNSSEIVFLNTWLGFVGSVCACNRFKILVDKGKTISVID